MTFSSVSTQSLSGLQMQKPPGMFNGKPPSKPNASDMADKLTKDLGLSDDQKKQLTTILQDNMKKMDSEMQKSAGNNSDTSSIKTKMDKNMNELNNQIKSILTGDQATKFQSMIDNMQKNQPKQNFQSILSEKNNSFSLSNQSLVNVYA